MLTSMRNFLELLFQITKFIEKQLVTIDRVLPLLEFLLNSYKIDALSHTIDKIIKLSIDTE
jgi:hypothetical protein